MEKLKWKKGKQKKKKKNFKFLQVCQKDKQA